MGSQTLEILRQGVWASLTGGWFYDPHQNLFCNTVHLYIWLFLLCLPFSVYLYFPAASGGWAAYCAIVALLFASLKLLNHALHRLYDTRECVLVPPPPDQAADVVAMEEGVEMQMLRLGGAAGSDNESVTSLEYHKPNNSTIDLKVDVHRKNSSESSIEESAAGGGADGAPPGGAGGAARRAAGRRPRPARRGPARLDERDSIVEEARREPDTGPAPPHSHPHPHQHPAHPPRDDGPFAKVSRRYHECSHRRGSHGRDFFKEWLYLDGSEAGGEPYRSRFARQLSGGGCGGCGGCGPGGLGGPPRRRARRRERSAVSRSAVALGPARRAPAASATQLPLLTSTAALVQHMRRHSNDADEGFFASVELGEYMLAAAAAGAGDAGAAAGAGAGGGGVRRIRSAALEVGCPPPSVSNLSPHPCSAEALGGGGGGARPLRNPQSAVLPPPSKSLTRGAPLTLYPRADPCPYLTYGSEIVYPIAEISDEMQTSQKETDLESSGDSYSDYEDEKQFQGFDWEAEQSAGAAQSSDSDYGDNGSRSPLLDRGARLPRPAARRLTPAAAPAPAAQAQGALAPNAAPAPAPAAPGPAPAPAERPRARRLGRAARPPACGCMCGPGCLELADQPRSTPNKTALETDPDQPDVEAPDSKTEKKVWEHESTCSSSTDSGGAEAAAPAPPDTEDSQLTADSRSIDERSVYSLDWLFEETRCPSPCPAPAPAPPAARPAPALGETSANVPKNLGAIPKQIKNLARSRASSQKENKKRDGRKEPAAAGAGAAGGADERSLLDAVEAQAALVQGLECLFAATNANTVVMPPPARVGDRERARRDAPAPPPAPAPAARKRSIEEMAQTSTSALLPTSMPLLAAFLSSRAEPEPAPPDDAPRPRPLMDRNHRHRVRKIKRSTRQRNNPPAPAPAPGPAPDPAVHFATSFEDTTDGAIHCFMDEHGNWMSYTFDKNGAGRTQALPIPLPGDEAQPPAAPPAAADGSSGSLESDAAPAPPAPAAPPAPPAPRPAAAEASRSPVAFATDSLLEQIEQERVSRMGLPSMHINFLMGQRQAEDAAERWRRLPDAPPRSDDRIEVPGRSKFSKLMDEMEKAAQPKPKSYYKLELFKRFELKITMDRLQLMALFDRNLSAREALAGVLLAAGVAILGAAVLRLGLYRDMYAFWFCFVMAGSQYSLLKSVQPDAASPVHGFNRMVVFSRPVYFCACAALLLLAQARLAEPADQDPASLLVYGLRLDGRRVATIAASALSAALLLLPLGASLGLFPQVDTFLMYLLEQIDMHIFGGNATSGLGAAVYCVARSLAAVGLLYGFAYSALVEGRKSHHQSHNALFSIFCGLLVPVAYHLSRSASDYSLVWSLIKKHLLPPELQQPRAEPPPEAEEADADADAKRDSESTVSKQNSFGSSASKINLSETARPATATAEVPPAPPSPEDDEEDPLPAKLQATVNARLKNDLIACAFLGLLVFGLHCTTVFATLEPQLTKALWVTAGVAGWAVHYVVPQLRKQQPWLCLAAPVLRPHEHAQFEVTEPARVMAFEKVYVYASWVERTALLPLLAVAACSAAARPLQDKYGDAGAALLLCVAGLKCLRHAYSAPSSQYAIVILAALVFGVDLAVSETFLVDYAVMALLYHKLYELLLKIQFVVTYIAPWQITWGSAFHAFAQPFSVPHSAMLFLQAAAAAAASAPLTPALGSAIFMTSYVRPVKFWERDYNTKRVDTSNTRLSSQLERNLGADDNNLNSIFYEHLTRSLQHYLCGDLALGRWGDVQQGDCFVLASDYLNCLVHIVEVGHGLVSFQLRGLEFRGTYCQQREVEAISEGPEEQGDGVCSGWWCGGCGGCGGCGAPPCGRLLSPGAGWALRWLAWQLVSARYVLEGYSVTDNSALSMLQVFDFRKVLLTYYVKSIIYYTLQSPKLEEWLSLSAVTDALRPLADRGFVDLDPVFNVNLDEDYDFRASGVTRARFCAVYGEWVSWCAMRRGAAWRRRAAQRDSPLLTLCFALSLLGRRALAHAQHLSASSVEFFLYGLHSLFKGDFRITCARDEWVFTDVALLRAVLAPAVRMALKLHQDHFMFPEEYSSSAALYAAIAAHAARLVICHESAPAWRAAVLRGAPHLLALRHVLDEGNVDDYKVIMLNKRHLGFRVIKLNRECVRGLWAGQQQELIYLRNRNPERGSIQNAKQALRNIINSSCDQPIGYPIYVSPLTTSYADTSPALCALLGGPLSADGIKAAVKAAWTRIRRRCGEGCSSGGGGGAGAAGAGGSRVDVEASRTTLHRPRQERAGTLGSLSSHGGLGGLGALGGGAKPQAAAASTLASLAGLLRPDHHDRPERTADEQAYSSTQESRRSEERISSGTAGSGAGAAAGGAGGAARRERNMRARTAAKDGRQTRAHSGGRSSRRARAAASLRGERTPQPPHESAPHAPHVPHAPHRHDVPRRSASAKVMGLSPAGSAGSVGASLSAEEGSGRAGGAGAGAGAGGGLDVSLPDCRIIANRTAHHDHARYFIPEGTSKDLSKPSKEIRLSRESYRDLAGRYTERPDAAPHGPHGPQGPQAPGQGQGISVGSKVSIAEPLGVYDCINLGRRIDVSWPGEPWRLRGGRSAWGGWAPSQGMDGVVVHKWTPNHRDPKLRSHVDKTILLVQIDDKFVPIAENCVHDIGDEV